MKITGTVHIDHILPKSRGGDNSLENGQVTCAHCNLSKGNRDLPVTAPPGFIGDWGEVLKDWRPRR
jgi:5-methylcytosine-specific restriction endonuclease McrA